MGDAGGVEPLTTGAEHLVQVRREVDVERLRLDETSWVDVARGWLAGADEMFEALRDGVAWQTSRLFATTTGLRSAGSGCSGGSGSRSPTRPSPQSSGRFRPGTG